MKIPNLNLFRRVNKPEAHIKIERTHYGIKFYLPEVLTEDELLKLLVRIPKSAYKLPDDQKAAFDFGERTCSKRLILHMINSIVWEKGINVTAWLSKNEESRKLFVNAGLCIIEPEKVIPVKEPEVKAPEPERQISALKVVYNSMRSGQRIETEGNVLVWGHLNPGAEIVAGGSVLVAGRLLGLVHAGGFGRSDVFVFAGSFETQQLRIANKLCYADERTTSCWRKSVVITLEEGQPVIRENKFLYNVRNSERRL